MIMPKIESKPDQNSYLSFWKKTLHVVVFLSLFILMFYCYSHVFKEKTHKYDTFYSSEKNSMDYLCAGISHTYYGINPVYIYTHSGYKGYNLGDEAQNIRFSYFWLREALKTQSPKVFFLDVGGLFYSESSMTEEWKLKEYSDMRFSIEKIQAADEGTDERNTRIGALFPLLYFRKHVFPEKIPPLLVPELCGERMAQLIHWKFIHMIFNMKEIKYIGRAASFRLRIKLFLNGYYNYARTIRLNWFPIRHLRITGM